MTDNIYGILMTDMKQWEKYLQNIESRNEENNDFYEKKAIRTAREYRDACLKYRADEEKRKCDWVDRAETIYDIMY